MHVYVNINFTVKKSFKRNMCPYTPAPPGGPVRYGTLLHNQKPITTLQRSLSLPSAAVLLSLLTQLCLKLSYLLYHT